MGVQSCIFGSSPFHCGEQPLKTTLSLNSLAEQKRANGRKGGWHRRTHGHCVKAWDTDAIAPPRGSRAGAIWQRVHPHAGVYCETAATPQTGGTGAKPSSTFTWAPARMEVTLSITQHFCITQGTPGLTGQHPAASSHIWDTNSASTAHTRT